MAGSESYSQRSRIHDWHGRIVSSSTRLVDHHIFRDHFFSVLDYRTSGGALPGMDRCSPKTQTSITSKQAHKYV